MRANPWQINGTLNRIWTDEHDTRFQVMADSVTANAITAAQDLAHDMPLFIGRLGRAMVLTSRKYRSDQIGQGSVDLAIVRDPCPGRGRRPLTPVECYKITFVTRIRLQPLKWWDFDGLLFLTDTWFGTSSRQRGGGRRVECNSEVFSVGTVQNA